MKKFIIKASVFISLLTIVGISSALVDSTTDNQLPSMRGWQDINGSSCRQSIGEMDLEMNNDYHNYVDADYKDKYSDIEEMESGGDPELGWVS
jgi:sporulation-control protein spo0M